MQKSEVARLADIFIRNRDKVFLIDAATGRQFTYDELKNLSLRFSCFLEKEGIRKGDKIAVILPNCPEFLIFYFSCMHIGTIAIPINPRLHPEEVGHILANSDIKLFFTTPSLHARFSGCIEQTGIKVLTFTPINETPKTTGEGIIDLFAEIERQHSSKRPFYEISDDDTFVIIYTSGTTSRPKAVVIKYGNILKNGYVFSRFLSMSSSLRFYNILSLAYLGGLYNLTLIPLLAEGSIVLEEPFSPRLAFRFWKNAKRYHINALWLVPSIISVLLSVDRSEEGAKYSKNNVKLALVGTAPLQESTKKDFENKYSVTLYENYGLSETFFIAANSPTGERNKGVGMLIPGVEISIVDDQGMQLSVEEQGEIVVKTDHFKQGYYKDEEATLSMLKNGMFHTGDIGYFDQDGYLFITDRKKDMIKKAGMSISPKEIEEVIAKARGVKEVAVVGIVDDVAGEEIWAVVKTEAAISEEQIKTNCRNHLAAFKVPRYVVFVKEFPRSVTGKIQKNKLKEILLARA